MLIVDGVKYQEWTPKSEEEFEEIIKEHAKDIFGEDSIYFDLKKKLKTRAGIGSIPDGYVVSLQEEPCWYICEVEFHTHPLYEHIIAQLQKIITGAKTLQSQNVVRDAIYSEITGDPFKEALIKSKIGTEDPHHFISNLISKPPILVIPIDQKIDGLEEACDGLPIEKVRIVEFKTFTREGVELSVHAHLFEPLFQRAGSLGNQKIIRTEEREWPGARGLKLYIKDGKHYNPKEALEALGATLNRMVEGRGDRRATMPDGTILEYVGSTKNGKSKIAKVHTYLLDHGFTFSQGK